MEINIAINRETCIKCGKCVRVCPSAIFTQESPDAEVELRNIQNCILCGHCAAVCPTSSVIHSEFPAEKIHKIDRNALPSPEQITLLIKSRRSNRAFSQKPVPEEYLDLILEAAHRAPTASNLQQVEFTLITDPEQMRMVAQYTVDIYCSIAKLLSNPIVKLFVRPFKPELYKLIPRLESLVRNFEKGHDPILRGATSLIFIHTAKGLDFGRDDANLAYQNGSLMAESLGVSQFYTGFVCRAIRQDKKNRLARKLGINGVIQAGLALGMPSFLYPNYMDKEDIKVNRL